MMSAYQALQAFDQGPSGPLNGQMTPAQEAFLVRPASSTWR